MNIIDLTEDYHRPFLCCLEEWSDDMREAGDHKERWLQKMADKGFRAKLALEGEDVCGLIQYVPIELGPAEGSDLFFVLCIWVHGYKNKGVGNRQKRGLGKALLQAAEEDARACGAKGMAAWGISLPFWMKASWFKKQGYMKVDKQGMAVLLWKPFVETAAAPRWIKERKKPGEAEGKVTVAAFKNGWCPAQNLVFERARRAAGEFGDAVGFMAVDTADRETFLEWGISDALFIDGRRVRTGPPPSYKKIRRLIEKRIRPRSRPS